MSATATRPWFCSHLIAQYGPALRIVALSGTASPKHFAGKCAGLRPHRRASRRAPVPCRLSQGRRPCGEVPEWLNGAVSKTVVRERVPRVRIPLSPPVNMLISLHNFDFDRAPDLCRCFRRLAEDGSLGIGPETRLVRVSGSCWLISLLTRFWWYHSRVAPGIYPLEEVWRNWARPATRSGKLAGVLVYVRANRINRNPAGPFGRSTIARVGRCA